MLIRLSTPNGTMTIVADAFFPATKKDIKKLKKAIVDPKDLEKVDEAIKNLIGQVKTYANDCKARKEIHEMSAKEEIEKSFLQNAENRKAAFYHAEQVWAEEMIRSLNQNLEDLHGKG